MLGFSGDERVCFFIDSEFRHKFNPIVIELCTIVHKSAAVEAVIIVVLLHPSQECTETVAECAVEASLAHNLLMNKIER